MGGLKNKGVNTKVQAAKEKQAANKQKKDAATAAVQEKQTAADWAKGSNARGAAREEAAAIKAEEERRKKQAKAALMAAEEDDMNANSQKVKSIGAGMKAKAAKKKKKNDFELLEEALVSGADRKSRAKKQAEREKKERLEAEERKRQEKKAEEAKAMDPLLANTQSMLGGAIIDHDNDYDDLVGRKANVQAMEEIGGTGIESALSTMNVSSPGDDQHPEKRMKALHKAFEERMMSEMKEQYPGLKKSQYQEKIFNLWKKSPENPMNHHH